MSIKIKCPICGKYKYWDIPFKCAGKYIQCQNCWSIINKEILLKRLKRTEDK